MRILSIAALVAALSFPAAARADERASLVAALAAISPSVGALYALEGGGDLRFLCSATAVDRAEGRTVILTAYHCMRKGVSYLINFGDNSLRPLQVWQIPHYELDAEKYPLAFGEPRTDMALFVMDGEDVPILPMAQSSALPDGARIAMVGFPLGLSKIAYEGIVAGRFERPGHEMADYLLLQIFGAPGSSGSAVVNVETGEIVGVLVAGFQAPAGLPVIFATPVEYRRWLREVAPEQAAAAGVEPEEAAAPAVTAP